MTTLKLIWPLLNVNLRSSGLIWLGTACYLKTTQLLSYLVTLGELWMSELPGGTPATHFWRQIRSLDRKTKKCLTLFTAISSDKRYLISMLLQWRQDSKDFPPGSACGIKDWKKYRRGHGFESSSADYFCTRDHQGKRENPLSRSPN